MKIDFVSLFSTYEGRINRGKYWITIAVYMVVFLILWKFILGGYVPGMDSDDDEPSTIMFLLGGLIYLAVAVSATMAAIKRLHDRDKSGWWVLLFGFAPAVLTYLGMLVPGMNTIFSLAATAISIWALVELGCLRGTKGPNQYGPDPLGA